METPVGAASEILLYLAACVILMTYVIPAGRTRREAERSTATSDMSGCMQRKESGRASISRCVRVRVSVSVCRTEDGGDVSEQHLQLRRDELEAHDVDQRPHLHTGMERKHVIDKEEIA